MLILSSASYQYYAKIQIFQKEKFGMFCSIQQSPLLREKKCTNRVMESIVLIVTPDFNAFLRQSVTSAYDIA